MKQHNGIAESGGWLGSSVRTPPGPCRESLGVRFAHPQPPCPKSTRRGLSLLEVMLALAILGLSLAATGGLIRIGIRSAEAARDLTRAQLYCESLMAEIVAGITPPQPVTDAPLDVQQEWLYAVEIQTIDAQGLVAVIVTVGQDPRKFDRPAIFTLVRWIPDPGLNIPDATEDAATQPAL